MAQKVDGIDFDVSVDKSVVTQTRIPAINTGSVIDAPSVVRANQAVSREHPEGSVKSGYSEKNKDYTVLQQHVMFWDRDMDGHIWPLDTYRGFRELGFNILFSLLALLIIHINFSYPTRLGLSYFPDPFFRVYVRDIHKAKVGTHGASLLFCKKKKNMKIMTTRSMDLIPEPTTMKADLRLRTLRMYSQSTTQTAMEQFLYPIFSA